MVLESPEEQAETLQLAMIASGFTITLTFSSAMPILNIVNTLLNKTIQDKQFQETSEARFTPLRESQNLEASYSIQVPKE